MKTYQVTKQINGREEKVVYEIHARDFNAAKKEFASNVQGDADITSTVKGEIEFSDGGCLYRKGKQYAFANYIMRLKTSNEGI